MKLRKTTFYNIFVQILTDVLLISIYRIPRRRGLRTLSSQGQRRGQVHDYGCQGCAPDCGGVRHGKSTVRVYVVTLMPDKDGDNRGDGSSP